MKRRVFLSLAVAGVIWAFVFMCGCSWLHDISADVEITSWQQAELGGSVTVDYKIKNTGDVPIDFYRITFNATCLDGSVCSGMDERHGVGVGEELAATTMIIVEEAKEVNKVTVAQKYLRNYTYNVESS